MAIAVAASMIARPKTVKTMPSAIARKSTTAFVLPAEATRPFRPPTLNSRYWTPLIRTPSGKKSRPIVRNGRRWPRYIRRDAVTIEPHERRRESRRGADGSHVVRDVSQRKTPKITVRAIRTGDGLPTRAVRTAEPPATAPQKNPVAVEPNAVPTGTMKLLSRHFWFAHAIG